MRTIAKDYDMKHINSGTTRGDRRRKLLAIVASGVVLGIGAVMTFASWTDQEWAKATFSTGTFDIQGSADGTTFADHPTASGALQLTFNGGNRLYPGAEVSVPYAIKLSSTSTYQGAIALSGSTTSSTSNPDLTNALSYKIYKSASWGCNVQPTDTPLVTSATAATTVSTPLSTLVSTSDQLNLCVVVDVAPTLPQTAQGKTADVTWEFTGTSGTSI